MPRKKSTRIKYVNLGGFTNAKYLRGCANSTAICQYRKIIWALAFYFWVCLQQRLKLLSIISVPAVVWDKIRIHTHSEQIYSYVRNSLQPQKRMLEPLNAWRLPETIDGITIQTKQEPFYPSPNILHRIRLTCCVHIIKFQHQHSCRWNMFHLNSLLWWRWVWVQV